MKTQLTNGMMMAVIINLVYAKAIGVTQGILARQAGGDMWIVSILSTLIGLCIMLLTVFIIKRYPNKNIFEQTRGLVGKWGEKILSLLLFIFFLGAFGGVMITLVYHLMDYFLPDAPTILFVIIAILAGIVGLFYGIEVIARVAILGTFSIIMLNILILFGSLSYFEIRHFFPVLKNGLWNGIEATKHPNGDWAMATLMVAILLPMVKEKQKWFAYTGKSIVFGGLLILLWPILQVGVLSPEVTGQYIVSCMQMARSAEIGLFIHRYELIMIIFFSLSALVQIMICLLCAVISVKHLTGVQNLNKLTIPVATILGAFGYWVVVDHIRAMDLLTYYWPRVAMPIAFGVPIIVFILGTVIKNKKDNVISG
ncbi:endospore germination permease [Evansella sp. AB-P1]|uniref:GerAB/ArcD/ProY family transporter n=1 Tax=Evansella sp. AB-P1 TaxID=3037653 RepID=UPI00241F4B3C|nr:endospore germination permease [Evansella sp. AB-P1]MDG5789951.1 endospore germination permease [Evansella sp. AB-P1]